MRKRTAFTLLMKGIESGWSIPDEAVHEGVEAARSMLADGDTPSRDKIRAAELLLMAREREAQRLLKLAELEETIESRSEIEGSMMPIEPDDGSADLAELLVQIKAEGPEYARTQRRMRQIVARKTAESAARVRPGDVESVRLHHETVKALHAAMGLALMTALDHQEHVRRLTAHLAMQASANDDDDDTPLLEIDPEDMFSSDAKLRAAAIARWGPTCGVPDDNGPIDSPSGITNAT